ncbi:DoxX family protein [Pseudoclavibacter chungangensis]|uniref:DoxX family protein n=1 Tax=Pseudoclavibacter chungangensis TaxID=587635 RepID=A0A7J5C0V8_9MICO|nr:DoxX family protein [Pseudoclavibacter chungangensis]KAB1662254.1 DoxX family protein [Pseudoclavibacter chungangensis]NYJ65459.1 putative oxidoreductase [Pseudoclavibacter chungangensis]
MRQLDLTTPALRDWTLLVLRIVLGGLLLAHGLQKLVAFGYHGTVGAFDGMGVPAAPVAAGIAIAVEVIGGLFLVLGLWLPVSGLVVAVYMAGVLVLAHAPFGPFATDGGWELVALYAVGSAALAVLGGGRYGIDGARLATRTARASGSATAAA